MQTCLKLGLLFSLIVCFSMAQAQDFSVPANYSFETKEDYAKYDQDILKAIDWLKSNSPNTSPQKRKEAEVFFIKWLTGTPAVSATLYSEIISLAKVNPELLTIFLGEWSAFTLNNPGKEAGKKRLFRISLKGMLAYYKKHKNKGLKKDKAMDTLLKKERKGELDDWINSVVK